MAMFKFANDVNVYQRVGLTWVPLGGRIAELTKPWGAGGYVLNGTSSRKLYGKPIYFHHCISRQPTIKPPTKYRVWIFFGVLQIVPSLKFCDKNDIKPIYCMYLHVRLSHSFQVLHHQYPGPWVQSYCAQVVGIFAKDQQANDIDIKNCEYTVRGKPGNRKTEKIF